MYIYEEINSYNECIINNCNKKIYSELIPSVVFYVNIFDIQSLRCHKEFNHCSKYILYNINNNNSMN